MQGGEFVQFGEKQCIFTDDERRDSLAIVMADAGSRVNFITSRVSLLPRDQSWRRVDSVNMLPNSRSLKNFRRLVVCAMSTLLRIVP